ncbi:MAG: hypothetical protein KME26_32910 [Oscillatoria princeps RMCB-10]|nr:hypothetical protein [Oscillatoria princeps RMCB-10]
MQRLFQKPGFCLRHRHRRGDKETGFLNKDFRREAKVIAESRFLPSAPAPARG